MRDLLPRSWLKRDSYDMETFTRFSQTMRVLTALAESWERKIGISPFWKGEATGDFCSHGSAYWRWFHVFKKIPLNSAFAKGEIGFRDFLSIIGLVVFLITLVNGVSLSAERPLRVAYPAPAGAFLPLWAAQDAGIFKKHGLSVELIAVGSSTRGIAAMVSGDLDILAGGGTAGITAQLQGYTDMALFANFIQTFLFSVMVQPAITEVSQLRGKRMGVTRFGGTLDFVARQYIKRNGMEPGKDVTFVQVGAMPDIVVAVSTGALEAGVVGVPQNFLAKKQGLRELADLSESGARYALAAFLAKRSFLTENHERMLRFMKALVESIYYLKTYPKEGMEIFRRYTRIDAPEILKPSYDLHIRLFPKVPEIFSEDLKLVLEEVALTNPKARTVNPGSLIDGRVVKEVLSSGFVDQLYR
ncbi:MAG TPA: ABC transporter substrate-binding protein [Methylomirabilota bacterium]|nr:ABC transporter substrate-binding protein [Methylomirabilota bacterium]